MPEPKPLIRDLYRTPGLCNRQPMLRLDMNENIDGLPADFVREVMAGITPDFLSVYPEYEELSAKIADRENLQPENVLLTAGSDGAIKLIYEAYIGPSDPILLTDPTFAMYPVYAGIFGAQATFVPYGDDLSFPFEQFRDNIGPETKMAVIVNPNNPTGTQTEPFQVEQLAKACRRSDALLVVDEAYYPFLDQTAVNLIDRFDNLVVLRTFSKLYAMAGLRLGYALGSPEVIRNLYRVRSSFEINALAVRFGTALMDRPDIIGALKQKVDDGRDYLVERLKAEGLNFRSGPINFILIDCGKHVQEFTRELRDRHILVACGFKHARLKNCIRLTLGGPELMKKFWDAFQEIRKSFPIEPALES